MTLYIENETKPDFSFHYRELSRKVIQAALDLEKFPYEAEVSLTLVNNEQIHVINREMRQIDRPTDVLSFPMAEYRFPADFEGLKTQWDGIVNPDTQEVMLGDIVLSLDKVKAQAVEYGHTEKREYAFLITHSMLHLMGYDHMTPEDAEVMEAHQRIILDYLKIYR